MDTLSSEPVAVKRVTSSSRYARMDRETWPAIYPPLTDAEAVRAARLLYRRFYCGRWKQERRGIGPSPTKPVKVSRKIKYATFAGGALLINPDQGWHGMVHSLSHRFHSGLRPRDHGHGDNHRRLERDMIAHVVESGWLDGKLMPKPKAKAPPKPKPDPLIAEHERILARIKAWQTKAKRAATALAKLRKEEAALRRKRERTIRFTLD